MNKMKWLNSYRVLCLQVQIRIEREERKDLILIASVTCMLQIF